MFLTSNHICTNNHNPIFDLQDSLSHKKSEAPSTMAEDGEHSNTEESITLKSYSRPW